MENARFDELVRAFGGGTSRRGVLGLLAAAAGLGLHEVTARARRHRKGKGKGKEKEKEKGKQAHGDGKRKNKNKKKNAHGKAKPICPGGRCDKNPSRCLRDGCVCSGKGSKSRCVRPTTTTTTVAPSTTTTPAPTTTTTTAAPTTTTTTAAPTTTTPPPDLHRGLPTLRPRGRGLLLRRPRLWRAG